MQSLLKYFIYHNLFWIFIIFTFFIFGDTALPQMSFYISPPLLEINQVGGGVRNFTIEISNTGQEKIQVKISFSDLLLSSEGNVQLVYPTGSTLHSLASWITSKQDEIISLNPNEIKNLLFQINVPRGEKGGRYGVIVFETLPFNMPQGKVSLGIRSGTLVFLTIPRTEEIKGIIEDISLIEGKEFRVAFRNNGNIHYETEGSLIIKNEGGKVLHRIRFPEEKPFLLLPQGTGEFIVQWDKKDPLPNGKYFLEARMLAWVGSRTLNLDRKEVLIELNVNKENETETKQ